MLGARIFGSRSVRLAVCGYVTVGSRCDVVGGPRASRGVPLWGVAGCAAVVIVRLLWLRCGGTGVWWAPGRDAMLARSLGQGGGGGGGGPIRLRMVSCGLLGCGVVAVCLAGAGAAGASRSAIPWGVASRVHQGVLSGVSCPTARVCTAVGGGLVERWHGGSWSTTQRFREGVELSAVSCGSAVACVAVGFDVSGDDAFVAHWNGTRWSRDRTRLHVPLSGVSCGAGDACMAVGTDEPGCGGGGCSPNVAGAQRWDGTRWLRVRLATRSNWADSWLSAVSCASARACTATGWFDIGDGCDVENGPCAARALVEHWNGRRWSIQPTPDVAGFSFTFSASRVACTSATVCTALWNGTPGFVAEHLSGSTWTVQPTVRLEAGTSTSLGGVSCTSRTACTAVGDSILGGHQRPFVERWNGSNWSMQQIMTPGPVNAVTTLNDVSCPSSTVCTAVGAFSYPPGHQIRLAERWEHRGWSRQPTA